MQADGLSFLANWQNYYFLFGSAAATLMGLMFIVTTLMAGMEGDVSTLNAGISAFSSPTIMHFCAVLLMAGILSAPWQSFAVISLLLGLLSLGMLGYLFTVIRQMRRFSDHRPSLQDWLWYVSFPLIAYFALIVAVVSLPANLALALIFIAAVMAALLFIGIRNAWDLVTFLASKRARSRGSHVD